MAASGLVLKAVTDSTRAVHLRKTELNGAPSLAARQAEMLTETRSILHDLLSVESINPSDIMSFFDSRVVDLIERREELFMATMMTAFKAEMQQQIQAAYTKAAATSSRADRAEKEAETLQARLSRRGDSWDRERSDLYRQILALRELLRRHGVADSNLVGLSARLVTEASGTDDPLGSTRTKALEQKLRQSEAEAHASSARAAEAVASSERLKEASQDIHDKFVAEMSLHEATKSELARARSEIDRLRVQGRAPSSPTGRGERKSSSDSAGAEVDGPDAWLRGGAEWGSEQRAVAQEAVRGGEANWDDAAEGLSELLVEPALRQAVENAFRQRGSAEAAAGSTRSGDLALPTTKAEFHMRAELEKTQAALVTAETTQAKVEEDLRDTKASLTDAETRLLQTTAQLESVQEDLATAKQGAETTSTASQTDVSGDIMKPEADGGTTRAATTATSTSTSTAVGRQQSSSSATPSRSRARGRATPSSSSSASSSSATPSRGRATPSSSSSSGGRRRTGRSTGGSTSTPSRSRTGTSGGRSATATATATATDGDGDGKLTDAKQQLKQALLDKQTAEKSLKEANAELDILRSSLDTAERKAEASKASEDAATTELEVCRLRLGRAEAALKEAEVQAEELSGKVSSAESTAAARQREVEAAKVVAAERTAEAEAARDDADRSRLELVPEGRRNLGGSVSSSADLKTAALHEAREAAKAAAAAEAESDTLRKDLESALERLQAARHSLDEEKTASAKHRARAATAEAELAEARAEVRRLNESLRDAMRDAASHKPATAGATAILQTEEQNESRATSSKEGVENTDSAAAAAAASAAAASAAATAAKTQSRDNALEIARRSLRKLGSKHTMVPTGSAHTLVGTGFTVDASTESARAAATARAEAEGVAARAMSDARVRFERRVAELREERDVAETRRAEAESEVESLKTAIESGGDRLSAEQRAFAEENTRLRRLIGKAQADVHDSGRALIALQEAVAWLLQSETVVDAKRISALRAEAEFEAEQRKRQNRFIDRMARQEAGITETAGAGAGAGAGGSAVGDDEEEEHGEVVMHGGEEISRSAGQAVLDRHQVRQPVDGATAGTEGGDMGDKSPALRDALSLKRAALPAWLQRTLSEAEAASSSAGSNRPQSANLRAERSGSAGRARVDEVSETVPRMTSNWLLAHAARRLDGFLLARATQRRCGWMRLSLTLLERDRTRNEQRMRAQSDQSQVQHAESKDSDETVDAADAANTPAIVDGVETSASGQAGTSAKSSTGTGEGVSGSMMGLNRLVQTAGRAVRSTSLSALLSAVVLLLQHAERLRIIERSALTDVGVPALRGSAGSPHRPFSARDGRTPVTMGVSGRALQVASHRDGAAVRFSPGLTTDHDDDDDGGHDKAQGTGTGRATSSPGRSRVRPSSGTHAGRANQSGAQSPLLALPNPSVRPLTASSSGGRRSTSRGGAGGSRGSSRRSRQSDGVTYAASARSGSAGRAASPSYILRLSATDSPPSPLQAHADETGAYGAGAGAGAGRQSGLGSRQSGGEASDMISLEQQRHMRQGLSGDVTRLGQDVEPTIDESARVVDHFPLPSDGQAADGAVTSTSGTESSSATRFAGRRPIDRSVGDQATMAPVTMARLPVADTTRYDGQAPQEPSATGTDKLSTDGVNRKAPSAQEVHAAAIEAGLMQPAPSGSDHRQSRPGSESVGPSGAPMMSPLRTSAGRSIAPSSSGSTQVSLPTGADVGVGFPSTSSSVRSHRPAGRPQRQQQQQQRSQHGVTSAGSVLQSGRQGGGNSADVDMRTAIRQALQADIDNVKSRTPHKEHSRNILEQDKTLAAGTESYWPAAAPSSSAGRADATLSPRGPVRGSTSRVASGGGGHLQSTQSFTQSRTRPLTGGPAPPVSSIATARTRTGAQGGWASKPSGSTGRSGSAGRIVEGRMPRNKGAAGAGVRVVGFRRSTDPSAAAVGSMSGSAGGSAPQGAKMLTTVVRQMDPPSGSTGGGAALPVQSLRMPVPLTSPSVADGGVGSMGATRPGGVEGWGSERIGQSDSVSLYVGRGTVSDPASSSSSSSGGGGGSGIGASHQALMPGGGFVDTAGRAVAPASPSIPSERRTLSDAALAREVQRRSAGAEPLLLSTPAVIPGGLVEPIYRVSPSTSRDGTVDVVGPNGAMLRVTAPPSDAAYSNSTVYGSAERSAPAEMSNGRFPAKRATLNRADTHDEDDG